MRDEKFAEAEAASPHRLAVERLGQRRRVAQIVPVVRDRRLGVCRALFCYHEVRIALAR